MKNKYLKFRVVFAFAFLLPMLLCTGLEDERSATLLRERSYSVQYAQQNYTFNGRIDTLVNDIARRGTNYTEADASTVTSIDKIEGVVTVRSHYVFSQVLGGSAANPSDRKIINQAFWMQDMNAGIMVFYDEDYDDDGYGDPDFTSGLVQPGDRIEISLSKVQKYESGGGLPIVTRFDAANIKFISFENPIYYIEQVAALSSSDVGKVVSVSGQAVQDPPSQFIEFTNGAYRFQADPQTSFSSKIAVEVENTSIEINFQINYSVAAGVRDDFDLEDGLYSYNIEPESKVRIYGPVFAPVYKSSSSDLTIAIGDSIYSAIVMQ